jgi:hypothetical protein
VPATLHIKTPPSGWGGGAWIAQNSLGFHFTPEQLPARLWRIVGLEITNLSESLHHRHLGDLRPDCVRPTRHGVHLDGRNGWRPPESPDAAPDL